MSRYQFIATLTIACFVTGAAQAHTTIWPREAKAGTMEH